MQSNLFNLQTSMEKLYGGRFVSLLFNQQKIGLRAKLSTLQSKNVLLQDKLM
jgi:hypothetical protein